jgi:hypothetical protein
LREETLIDTSDFGTIATEAPESTELEDASIQPSVFSVTSVAESIVPMFVVLVLMNI